MRINVKITDNRRMINSRSLTKIRTLRVKNEIKGMSRFSNTFVYQLRPLTGLVRNLSNRFGRSAVP